MVITTTRGCPGKLGTVKISLGKEWEKLRPRAYERLRRELPTCQQSKREGPDGLPHDDVLHADESPGVVGVEHAQGHGGQDHGEVEEQRGGRGLADGVLAHDAVLEVVQVVGEPPGQV